MTGRLSLEYEEEVESLTSAEFSANSKVLYTSGPINGLQQYNLNDIENIPQSIQIEDSNNISYLKRGPNGQIFVNERGNFYIGAIKNPDEIGLGCDFNTNVLSISGATLLDFPTFLQPKFPEGISFINICEGLKEIAQNNLDTQIIYPVHLNPNVQKPVYKLLNEIDNIKLIAPLSYPAFVWLMEKSHLIITDSGGVQEEAPSLGKPVLVMRNTTERPEAVEAGTVILVGTDKNKIVEEANKLLNDKGLYNSMSMKHNPYGDGKACDRIIEVLLK